MSYELSKKEVTRLNEIAEEYKKATFTSQINEEKARKSVEYLYSLAKIKPLKIIICDSPLACRYVSQMIVEGQKVDEKEIFNFKEIVDTKPDVCWDRALEALLDAIAGYNPNTKQDYSRYRENAKNFLKKKSYKKSDNDVSFCWSGSNADCGYLSFYKLFIETGKITSKDEIETYKKLDEYVRSGIYDCIQYRDICIVSKHPVIAKMDDSDRFHCEDGYAVKWADEVGYCIWHGVKVPEQVIYFPETITKDDILKITNVEVKRAYKEILGNEKFFSLLDLVEVNASTDLSGRPLILHRTRELEPLISKYIYFLEINDHSTDRNYFICVEGTSNDARTELAKSYGKKSWEDYAPDYET